MIYKIVSLVVSTVAGPLAGRLFRRAWHRISGNEVQPDPTDRSHTLRSVLLSAALRGAIFAVVSAVLSRAAVTAVEVATDTPAPAAR